ncbi:MAG TPA: hypothetical protein VEU97_08840 [Ktedonobacteraceae bacterium]|nr:hypothetical protein [Ktedonobacteraceae bacterium]
MNNPGFLAIILVVFLLLGVYSVFTGLRRQREAQLRGQRIRWYRQINILTGIEYLLLSMVFGISLNLRNSAFPSFLRSLVVPFYLVVLAASAILAAFVIRQAISNARQISKSSPPPANRNSAPAVRQDEDSNVTPEQRAANVQRRRERRQKAAAARRRRSGKA